MRPVDADLVRRKLAVITRNLDDLEDVTARPLDAYLDDRLRRKATERLLQELIEAAVDANMHLIRSRGEPAPGDYYSSFVELGRAGVLSESLAGRLAPAAGMRNRLVHEYDDIDDRIVFEAARDARRDFTEYVAAVERHLSEQGH